MAYAWYEESIDWAWLGVHGVYVNSPLVDEWALGKQVPYMLKGGSIPIGSE